MAVFIRSIDSYLFSTVGISRQFFVVILYSHLTYKGANYCRLVHVHTCFNSVWLFSGCGQPSKNPGTIVEAPSTAVGDVAEYTCAPGHENLFGPEARTCLSDGTWSGQAPVCSPIEPQGILYLIIDKNTVNYIL